MVRHFFHYLFSHRWSLLLCGLLLLTLGLLIGSTSHQITYQSTQYEAMKHYLHSDNNAYLQLEDDSLYFLYPDDLNPTFTPDVLQGYSLLVVTYDTQDMLTIDKTAFNTGTNLNGSAYHVVQIAVYDENKKNPLIFTSDAYQKNPHGPYKNNWFAGGFFMLLGLAFFIRIFFLPRPIKKKEAVEEAMEQLGMSLPVATSQFYQKAMVQESWPPQELPSTHE
ncbi:hypothetical protein [Tengunoibacter tsumagoiensis]|uniref:Uncharacterized protein n=1 Tax=Tengunoibacter tsumagoiensis TaxID=2014871 RepID=A0A402A6A8_9CHLR|nr:hypothetical protein [Tengunoibacter tsumagoiensis]GCE14673.1 hypothetical protein KTT_45320 [Tengunoibacter tsumagoiensis]